MPLDRVIGQPLGALVGSADGQRGCLCVCRAKETKILRTVRLTITFTLGLLAAPLAAEA